jgi:hypothetical protein
MLGFWHEGRPPGFTQTLRREEQQRPGPPTIGAGLPQRLPPECGPFYAASRTGGPAQTGTSQPFRVNRRIGYSQSAHFRRQSWVALSALPRDPTEFRCDYADARRALLNHGWPQRPILAGRPPCVFVCAHCRQVKSDLRPLCSTAGLQSRCFQRRLRKWTPLWILRLVRQWRSHVVQMPE